MVLYLSLSLFGARCRDNACQGFIELRRRRADICRCRILQTPALGAAWGCGEVYS
jgi:hypothetical protein